MKYNLWSARAVVTSVVLAVTCATARKSVAQLQGTSLISSSGAGVGGPFTGININTFLGANAFYTHGYTGAGTVIADIEAGLVWNGQESLTNATTDLYYTPDAAPSLGGTVVGSQLGQFDRHATWTGAAAAGRETAGGGYYQQGMAYGATLWSGAIATSWSGAAYTGSFNIANDRDFLYPYLTAMQTGVNGRKADVITSSWGFADPTGYNVYTATLDYLAAQNHVTAVYAAGNAGNPSPTSVVSPGAGYNGITVGSVSTDSNTDPYNAVSYYSSGGLQNYAGPDGTATGVRAVVSLLAPGDDVTLAFYGGTTGGNTGGTNTPGSSLYSGQLQGTSFSTPLVAGGAALIDDVGYAAYGGGLAIDPTVVKAVLLNSADKLAGWNNAQSVIGGVITTTQGLDATQGAGLMDLNKAYAQYTAGTHNNPGAGNTILPIGWVYGTANLSGPSDYYFNTPLQGGTNITATLDWMVQASGATLDGSGDLQGAYVEFTNLDLQVWEMEAGGPDLIAQSISTYENTDQLYFNVPTTADYFLQVLWGGKRYDFNDTPVTSQDFGLAWSATEASETPEPSAWIAMVIGCLGVGRLALRRRRYIRS